MKNSEVFEIVRNFRKTRVIKHRNKKYVPPISVETRRMSRVRDRASNNDLDDIIELH